MKEEQEVSDQLKQHYNVYRSFNNTVYKKTLTAEHLIRNGNETYIDIVYKLDKATNGQYNIESNKEIYTKCVFLEKSGKKYILPAMFQKQFPINIKTSWECYLKPSDKTIYIFIQEPTSVYIGPEKILSLKDVCSVWNPLLHTHPKTWTFLKLQAIASKAKGGKFRLCSKPSTGKNSCDTVIHAITNDNVKVSKPTIAKLETLFYYNQKVMPDEMTSLTTQQVREVEPFFLQIADESPHFQKHSMAKRKELNEVDITRSSCIFTYNDPDSLQPGTKFFDDIWQNQAAFDSRYPAFLLEGYITSELPKLSMTQSSKIAKKYFKALSKLAKCLVYYFQNMSNELHGYDRSKCVFRGRHRTNTECIIDAMDVYSETQEEFDDWLYWIACRYNAYKLMVQKYKTHG